MDDWRDVPEFDGYQVTSDGRVRGRHGRELKQSTTARGYRFVRLRRDGKPVTQGTHRVVLAAFVGPCPPSHQGAHLDGCPGNNQLENLAWVTPTENAAHKIEHGTWGRKIDAPTVRRIRQERAAGLSYRRIAVQYNITHVMVLKICNRQSWAHVK